MLLSTRLTPRNNMRFCSLLYFLIVPWAIFAQGTTDFYDNQKPRLNGIVFRTGVNYSITRYSTTPNVQLGNLEPRAGLYIGSFYYKDLAVNGLVFRADAIFQARQLGGVDKRGLSVRESKYYYVGISPLLGLRLATHLTAFVGPELNVQIGRNDTFGRGQPIEVGAITRVVYAFRKIGVECSYFRGFSPYEQFTLFGDKFDFYNQNWQIGITHTLFH